MKRLAGIGFIVAVLGVVAGAPTIAATIVIEPASPGPADSVHVTVYSGYSMGCWTSLGTECSTGPADTLQVTGRTQYCDGGPPCPCPMMPIVLVRRCVFGPLAPGDYVVRFTEIHVNPADPFATSTQAQDFTVGASTPATRRSWGRLKLIHR